MSANKYEWEEMTDADLDALKAFAENAVQEERIVIKRKEIRSQVTKLLDAGIKNVPGVRLIKKQDDKPEEEAEATPKRKGQRKLRDVMAANSEE